MRRRRFGGMPLLRSYIRTWGCGKGGRVGERLLPHPGSRRGDCRAVPNESVRPRRTSIQL